MQVPLPPYAIAAPSFRFRALAMHAGRAPLGGEREIALACFAVARVAAGMQGPFMLAAGDAATRATAAKQWLASLALPANTRTLGNAVIDAVAAANRTAAGSALRHLTDVAAPHLDNGSMNELNELINQLTRP
jgi:hypothetical protein